MHIRRCKKENQQGEEKIGKETIRDNESGKVEKRGAGERLKIQVEPKLTMLSPRSKHFPL